MLVTKELVFNIAEWGLRRTEALVLYIFLQKVR